MLMKNGSVAPQILAQALEKDTYALMVFMKMNSNYQEMCIDMLVKSEESSPSKRVRAVIEEIHKYGKMRGL